jgi:hypothetical protein
MSDIDPAALRAAEQAHEKARMLASEAIDVELTPADATWLAEHQGGCEECARVADEYRALHDELRALPRPEPPRDLWPRTSAALDRVDRARTRGHAFGWRLSLSGNRSLLGSAVAVGITVVVVGLSLLSQGPIVNQGQSPSATGQIAAVSPSSGSVAQAPLAVMDGTSYWVAPENGGYQIRGGSATCTGMAESCAVTSSNGTVLGSIASKSAVSVVIAPDASQAAVWTSDKIVILPLAQSAPQTVSIDLLTPRPTAASPSPAVATNLPTPGASSAVEPSATPATPGASSAVEPSATPATPAGPAETQAAAASQSASPVNSISRPTAILDGYQIVGRAPEFSADGLWVAFSARPADLSSGSDVYVWRAGWDRAVAVTTSHADLFAGWFGAQILISEFSTVQPGTDGTAVPTAQPGSSGAPASDVPATAGPGAGSGADVVAISYVYDPLTGSASRIDRPMLLPVADPTGRYLVYWSGTLQFNQSTGLWGPGEGDLYFDAWSDIQLVPTQMGGGAVPTPTPGPSVSPTEPGQGSPSPIDTASPAAATDGGQSPDVAGSGGPPTAGPGAAGLPQLLPVTPTPDTVESWVVQWDDTGQYVAIWVANPGATDAGTVTLLNVVPGAQMVNTGGALLSKPAQSNIQFDADNFVYTSPGPGGTGTTYLFALPQVAPSPPATPQAGASGSPSPDQSGTDQTGADQTGAGTTAPVSTDRPGS